MIRRIMIPVLITSLLVSLLQGCGSYGAGDDVDEKQVTEEEKEEIWEGLDRQTTACNEVTKYLLECARKRGEKIYDYFSNHIFIAKNQCKGEFTGESLISVYALGYGYDINQETWRYYHSGGLWYYHEDTGTVEAGNELAEELLAYMETFESEVPTPSEVCDLLRDDLLNKALSSHSLRMQVVIDKYYPIFQIPNNCEAERGNNGVWTIESLGYGYDETAGEWKYYEQGGKWYYHEDDGNIEPGNLMAENLLKYLKGAEEDSLGK